MSDQQMSIVEGVKAFAMRPLQRAVAETRMAEADRAYAESVLGQMEEVVRRVRDDEDGWIPIGGNARDLDPQDRDNLLSRARRDDLRSPTIVGYRKALTAYVMGKGLTISADTGREQTDEQIDDWWGTVQTFNGWDRKEDEIPRRVWRDGECFLRRFVHRIDGPVEGWEPSPKVRRRLMRMGAMGDIEPPRAPAGMVFYRFLDPEHIRDPKGVVSHGIVTAEGDVETVLGYLYSPDGSEAEFLPAREVLHIKIRSDSDVKRGRSLYEPLLKRNKQYEDWLKYRVLLNLARTAIVLVKKLEKATPSQVKNLRNAQLDERNNAQNDRKIKTLEPMTTIHSSGIDYEFKQPNLQATDAQKDGRAILLNMAAATNLPEFMFTADANSMNFATSLAAEAPAMREFESWQDFFQPHFVDIWRQAVRWGAEFGQIQGVRPDDVMEMDPHVSWEPVQVREELEHEKAQAIRHDAGILSKETWADDSGLDWETEQERIEAEREDSFEMTPPPRQPPPPPGMEPDDEEEPAA